MDLHPTDEVNGGKLKHKVIENFARVGTENLWHSQKQTSWLPALSLNHNTLLPVHTHAQRETPVNKTKNAKTHENYWINNNT